MERMNDNRDSLRELLAILELLRNTSSSQLTQVRGALPWLRQASGGYGANARDASATSRPPAGDRPTPAHMTQIPDVAAWLEGRSERPSKWYMQRTAARARLIETVGIVLGGIKSRPSALKTGAYELLGTSRRVPSAYVRVILPPAYDPDDLDTPVAMIVQLGASTTSVETCVDQIEDVLLAVVRAQQEA